MLLRKKKLDNFSQESWKKGAIFFTIFPPFMTYMHWNLQIFILILLQKKVYGLQQAFFIERDLRSIRDT